MEKVVHGPAFEGGAGFQPMKQDGKDDSERRGAGDQKRGAGEGLIPRQDSKIAEVGFQTCEN